MRKRTPFPARWDRHRSPRRRGAAVRPAPSGRRDCRRPVRPPGFEDRFVITRLLEYGFNTHVPLLAGGKLDRLGGQRLAVESRSQRHFFSSLARSWRLCTTSRSRLADEGLGRQIAGRRKADVVGHRRPDVDHSDLRIGRQDGTDFASLNDLLPIGPLQVGQNDQAAARPSCEAAIGRRARGPAASRPARMWLKVSDSSLRPGDFGTQFRIDASEAVPTRARRSRTSVPRRSASSARIPAARSSPSRPTSSARCGRRAAGIHQQHDRNAPLPESAVLRPRIEPDRPAKGQHELRHRKAPQTKQNYRLSRYNHDCVATEARNNWIVGNTIACRARPFEEMGHDRQGQSAIPPSMAGVVSSINARRAKTLVARPARMGFIRGPPVASDNVPRRDHKGRKWNRANN